MIHHQTARGVHSSMLPLLVHLLRLQHAAVPNQAVLSRMASRTRLCGVWCLRTVRVWAATPRAAGRVMTGVDP